jgi:hypothetical protein
MTRHRAAYLQLINFSFWLQMSQGMKHENPDLPHQYVDVFKAAGAPERLRSKVIFERVWRRETIERHTEALRIFENRRDIYSRFDKMPREELNRRTLKRLQTLVGHAFENIQFYKRLYSGAGFQQGDLQSLEDFSHLPIVQKSDLRSLYQESSGATIYVDQF